MNAKVGPVSHGVVSGKLESESVGGSSDGLSQATKKESVEDTLGGKKSHWWAVAYLMSDHQGPKLPRHSPYE